MPDDGSIATHSDPVWRERTNYIVRLDLTEHGMPGSWEQCWTRTADRREFEMCCIPLLPYGISLGDILTIDLDSGAHRVVRKSGHRTLRIAYVDDRAAHEGHARLHEQLVGELGCLVEFRSEHFVAVDIATQDQAAAVVALATPLASSGQLLWEWADPTVD